MGRDSVAQWHQRPPTYWYGTLQWREAIALLHSGIAARRHRGPAARTYPPFQRVAAGWPARIHSERATGVLGKFEPLEGYPRQMDLLPQEEI